MRIHILKNSIHIFLARSRTALEITYMNKTNQNPKQKQKNTKIIGKKGKGLSSNFVRHHFSKNKVKGNMQPVSLVFMRRAKRNMLQQA